MSEKQLKGIVPAFYACYDKEGRINKEMVRKFTRHLIKAGVDGLYVGGSSGECIYQNVEDRKAVLEEVMKEADNEIFVIAHVACNGVEDSRELARHAESLGVDAIAAIPPIYFKVGDEGVAKYWNDISAAAPSTDFIIYNIPQLTGVVLNRNILSRMLQNDRVIGVKNSSMAALDIYDYIDASEGKLFVFNGPDEQLISGLAMGAVGGIGGTYGLMPELYIKLYRLFHENKIAEARALQYDINKMIYLACSGQGSMYAIIKAALNKKYGFHFNGVKAPLINKTDSDNELVDKIVEERNQLYRKYSI